MKLKFTERKGHRIKSSGLFGVRSGYSSDLWWFNKQRVWAPLGTFQSPCGTHIHNVNSVKAFRRFLRKLAGALPSGTEFILCSRYAGHDIYGRVPKYSSKRVYK